VRRAVVAVCFVAAQLLASAPHASAIITRPVVVATIAPANYVPLMVVVRQGMSLQLVQLDPMQRHDIVSRAARERRPVFASARSLSFGETQLVPGVEKLPPGAYPFTCSIHPFMFGQVIVE
jgi:plastocyanin